MLIATALFCVHDTGFTFSSSLGAAYLANFHERKETILNVSQRTTNYLFWNKKKKQVILLPQHDSYIGGGEKETNPNIYFTYLVPSKSSKGK